MIPVPSDIEGKQAVYGEIKDPMEKEGFVLGDNWEYDSGFFDGVLDEEYSASLYLRLPFEVIEGELDGDKAVLRFEQPFILKHIFNLDFSKGHTENPSYDPLQAGYLMNQFQEPADNDGEIENADYWIEQAKSRLSKIAHLLQ